MFAPGTSCFNFNSRPSARGDERGHPPAQEAQYFNSRPSARGDTSARLLSPSTVAFQFTPLREGRQAGALYGYNVFYHFNSRPSARGDAVWVDKALFNDISIHAPPRGATQQPRRPHHSPPISIHAPPRGATRRARHHRPSRGNFNSRPSARGDGKRYAISANLLFNPYKSAWLNNRATQFVEIILVIFHRIIV